MATSPALQTFPELGGKRLELLKEAISKEHSSDFSSGDAAWSKQNSNSKELKPAAGSGTEAEISGRDHDSTRRRQRFREHLPKPKAKQVGADYDAVHSPLFRGKKAGFVELAGKYQLPAIYPQRESLWKPVVSMSYGTDST